MEEDTAHVEISVRVAVSTTGLGIFGLLVVVVLVLIFLGRAVRVMVRAVARRLGQQWGLFGSRNPSTGAVFFVVCLVVVVNA